MSTPLTGCCSDARSKKNWQACGAPEKFRWRLLGKGQEAISAALGVMLKSGDIFGPLIRDQAGRLAFGESLIDIFRVHLDCVTAPAADVMATSSG